MARKPHIPPPKRDWWHVDSKGRRIGWMWPEDFKIAIDSIWGSQKGIQNFAKYSGLTRTTIETYANGKTPVPKHIALLVAALTRFVKEWRPNRSARARTADFPQIEAPWLQKSTPISKFGVESRPFE